MTIDFYFTGRDNLKELENIVFTEAKSHFGDKVGLKTEACIHENSVFGKVKVDVNSELYFKDLRKAKDAARETALSNSWHNLKENPEDLPVAQSYEDQDHWEWYLLKTDYTSYKSCHYEICARVLFPKDDGNDEPTWLCGADGVDITDCHVFEWKRLNADEPIFHDFVEDVEENLSFVSKVEIS